MCPTGTHSEHLAAMRRVIGRYMTIDDIITSCPAVSYPPSWKGSFIPQNMSSILFPILVLVTGVVLVSVVVHRLQTSRARIATYLWLAVVLATFGIYLLLTFLPDWEQEVFRWFISVTSEQHLQICQLQAVDQKYAQLSRVFDFISVVGATSILVASSCIVAAGNLWRRSR